MCPSYLTPISLLILAGSDLHPLTDVDVVFDHPHLDRSQVFTGRQLEVLGVCVFWVLLLLPTTTLSALCLLQLGFVSGGFSSSSGFPCWVEFYNRRLLIYM